MPELTAEDVRKSLLDLRARVELARLVGGISHIDVIKMGKGKPEGFWFDMQSQYWIPNRFTLETYGHG